MTNLPCKASQDAANHAHHQGQQDAREQIIEQEAQELIGKIIEAGSYSSLLTAFLDHADETLADYCYQLAEDKLQQAEDDSRLERQERQQERQHDYCYG